MAQDFKLCGLCLSKTKTYFDLTKDSCSTMLEAITAIKIDPLSNPQTVMCLKCRLNLRLAYVIQQNIIKSYSEFENVLQKLEAAVAVKEEISFAPLEEVLIVKEEPQESSEINKNVFSCGICHRQFNLKRSLYSHCHRKHPGKDYNILTTSSEGFQVSEPVRRQVKKKKQTVSSDIHSCSVCGKQFRIRSSLRAHMHVHSEIKKSLENKNDTEACFRCEHCPRSYTSKSALKCHFHVTHKKRNCPVCNKMFISSNYYKHLEIHRNKPRQVCHICGVTSASKEALRGHIAVLHCEKAAVLRCDVCHKQYRSRSGLSNHKISAHGGERTKVCEICGKKFFNLSTLWTHRSRIHLKPRKFTCEFCKRDFASRNSLNTHRRQHTNQTPFTCDVCGEGFRQKVSMKTHMRSKHNIEDEKNVVCGVCGKKFATDIALMTHQRVHERNS